MNYRAEIDGLRAVAVVPVILFHAGFQMFSGGYVGVDVFFVISGYLITGILIAELEAGQFSILGFYERRARRILPALFFVMLCSIPFAWLWLPPTQLKEFAQALVAVSLFASNILFWRKDDYFAPAAEENPLLHTWSLAVEEQFYVVFPLLLLLIWRMGRRPRQGILILVTVASLLFSEWAWRNAPSANFYLAPSRAWELLAGSLCAFAVSGREPRSNAPLAAIGLALIGVSVFAFDENTPFPSVYALAPVLGTVLILYFGSGGTWVGRLLSSKPFVGIGLISYSAYLWHQPLFAFARVRSLHPPSVATMLFLAAMSILLAYLSWRYVERPFRRRSNDLLHRQRTIFVLSAVGAMAFVALGLFGHLAKGFPDRITAAGETFAELRIEDRLQINYGLNIDCTGQFTQSPNCRTDDRPAVLLWGDSFAMHLAQALTATQGPSLQQHTISVCSPLLGISLTNSRYGLDWARDCIGFNDQVLEWLARNDSVKVVILSSPFGILTEDILLRSGDILREPSQMENVVDAMRSTVLTLRAMGKRVVVVSPPPNTGEDLGACLGRALIFGAEPEECDFAMTELSPSNRRSFALMERIAEFVPVIRLDDLMCSQDGCDTFDDGVFLYRDKGHLSKEGSAHLGRKFGFLARAVQTAL